jgi:hypothetical protein
MTTRLGGPDGPPPPWQVLGEIRYSEDLVEDGQDPSSLGYGFGPRPVVS